MCEQNKQVLLSDAIPDLGETTGPTRRAFLKGILFGAANAILFPMGAIGSVGFSENIHVQARPVVPGEAGALPAAIGHVARVSVDESACASCGLCSLVCAVVHGDAAGHSCASIGLERYPFECRYVSIACQQCDAPECYYACDAEGAFYIHEKTGARVIDSNKCIGCRQCIEACVFEIPRIQWDSERNVAFKCDLCSDRPKGPACIEFCPQQALKLTREAGA